MTTTEAQTRAQTLAQSKAHPTYTPPPTRWTLAPPASLPLLTAAMQATGLSAPAASVLLARGYGADTDALKAALHPPLTLTPNAGLREAARRVVAALRGGKRLRIHGDYDADGVTATATLVLGLNEVAADLGSGATTHGFIPHRLREGYGVHPSKLDEHAIRCDLLLTVDCGVSNHAEVLGLLERGLEVIVTDHHAPSDEFPDCLVVHPHLTANYDDGWHNLTGAGVAYHLLWAVCEELGRAAPEQYLPLATIGTVADVAPLTGENRALVQRGLELMPATQLAGMRALLDSSRVNDPITARDVAFGLAPRLNAAGRMGEADVALELLTTSSPQRAQALAEYLETRNNERKSIQEQMFEEALDIADPTQPAIVVTKDGWHAGVMGIVASKLLETYYKPVFIMAEGKGSVRSVAGISAVGALRTAGDLLLRYGGHTGAAGFSVDPARFGELTARLNEYVAAHPTPTPTLQLDAPLPAPYVGLALADELRAFAPFGEGWPAPLWHLCEEPAMSKLVGGGKHLQFLAGGLRGVQFGQSEVPLGRHDMALSLHSSEWRGQVRAEWQAEAMRPAVSLTCGGPEGTAANLPRLLRRDPTEVQPRLETAASGVRIYAEGKVLAHLQAKLQAGASGHAFLPAEAEAVASNAAPLVLFALPPAEVLAAWLRTAQGGPPVTFAWGTNTLQALQGGAGPHESAEAEALAYWRYRWAHAYTTLDDAGFARAAAGLLGV